MARKPVIKTVNLCKYYQMGKTVVRANQKINLEIYSGEFISIFGSSGCGKSTLMSLLAGLDEPTSGEILIRGERLNDLNALQLAKYRRTKIGMVFQQYNLIKTMTACENVALPLAFDGKSKRVRSLRAKHVLEMVGLADSINHTPAVLSGGQQQRVAIARAWVASPWIVLGDEPTGNLDSKSASDVVKLLKKLNVKSKRTVILITHNPEYLKYADRVVYLKDGVVSKITGKTKTIRKRKRKETLGFLTVDKKMINALKRAGYKSAKEIIKVKIADLEKIRSIDDIQAARIQKEATQFLEKEGELIPSESEPEEKEEIEENFEDLESSNLEGLALDQSEKVEDKDIKKEQDNNEEEEQDNNENS